MAAGDKIKWNEADFQWDNAPTSDTVARYTWNDIRVLEELISDGAGTTEILWQVDKLDPEKKKRFIRLVCKVKGIETYSGQKTIKTDDIKITAEDVELVIKEVLGIDLTVENMRYER